MPERATPAQDKLAAFIVSDLRERLTVEEIRALGVPDQVHSDYELHAAIERDRVTESPGDRDMADYDRRVLLNVIAWLVATPPTPDAGLTAEALADEIKRHQLSYRPDGSPSCDCDGPWADDHWFEEHVATAFLARLSTTAAPPPAGLDVERLARAIGSVVVEDMADITAPPQRLALDAEACRQIAAEYARLAQPEAPTDG